MTEGSLSSDLIIRTATFNDIPLIQDIVAKTWPVAYTDILGEKQVSYMIDLFYSASSLLQQMNNQHCFLVAFNESNHIGFASFSHKNDCIYKLEKLYVLPTDQKTGAGKALLQTVEKEALSMGAAKLRLNVNRKNIAKTFYQKNGFKVIAEEDIDIGNGYFMNDYIMEKDLPVPERSIRLL